MRLTSYWISPTSILKEVNDLSKGFGKNLFFKLAFEVKEDNKSLLLLLHQANLLEVYIDP